MTIDTGVLNAAASVGTFAFLGAGQLVTWIMIGREDRRSATKRAAERAAQDATDKAERKAMAESIERVVDALGEIRRWADSHEVSDERRWATAETLQRQQSETNQRLASVLEGLADRMNAAPPRRVRSTG